MNDIYKTVCVVGAGPAGSMSGYLLQQAGLQVTIVERDSLVRRKVCGEYLCPSGVKLLHDLGLEEVVDEFLHVPGMKIVSPKGRSILSFFPEEGAINYGASVNRSTFDQSLRQLARSSGCNLIEGESVISLEKGSSSWKVSTSERVIVADLVVAAEGITSPCAQMLGHKSNIDTKRIALHVYLPLKSRELYSRLGQMHILSDGSYVGLSPINEDEVNFSIVCSKDKLKNVTRKEIINNAIRSSKVLRLYFDEIGDDVKISTAGSIKNINKFIAGDGLAYVGDSAGFIDPLTGEGMYSSIQGAVFLSAELSKSPSNLGLKNYKKRKNKFFKEKNVLNNIFQVIIRLPFVCELMASFLLSKQKRADTFIGIIGNIYKPLEGLKKLLFIS